MKTEGFIVMLDALVGWQPVFRDEEQLIFFNTKSEAQAEINECREKTDYRIQPAKLIDDEIIEVEMGGELFSMYRTEEKLTKGGKFAMIVLKIRDGESEYYIPHAHRLPPDTSVMEFADNQAKQWYEFDEEDEDAAPEARDGGYYHNGGTIFAEVDRTETMPASHYEILKMYFL